MHVLTGDGIYTDCDKIEAVKNVESPGVYVKFVVPWVCVVITDVSLKIPPLLRNLCSPFVILAV